MFHESEYTACRIPIEYYNARQDLEAKLLHFNEGFAEETRFAYFNWADGSTDCIDITVIYVAFAKKKYFHIGQNYYAPFEKIKRKNAIALM